MVKKKLSIPQSVYTQEIHDRIYNNIIKGCTDPGGSSWFQSFLLALAKSIAEGFPSPSQQAFALGAAHFAPAGDEQKTIHASFDEGKSGWALIPDGNSYRLWIGSERMELSGQGRWQLKFLGMDASKSKTIQFAKKREDRDLVEDEILLTREEAEFLKKGAYIFESVQS